MNNSLSQLKRKLFKKMLFNVIVTLAAFLTLAGIFMFVSWLYLSRFIWQESPQWAFLHFVNRHRAGVLMFLGAVCAVILWIRSWRQMMGYLNETVEAAEIAARTDDQPIVLSPELGEVEDWMNQIKSNVKAHERAAREAEQRKNDLIIYLAHDLKTPLTSVIGYLTLLRDEQQISPQLREKYLNISLDKAERLEDLINEFFEITKFNLTTFSLEYSTVNLTLMLEQIVYEFAPMFAPKNLTCTLDCPKDIQLVCDRDKIQRVFDNLIRNAVNYSYENSEIKIQVLEDAGSVQCQFTNHGATIPPEKLQRIFEQFYRLDTARMTKTGGAGLGLAIAKEIVERHKGIISAYSANETVRFVVKLPKYEHSFLPEETPEGVLEGDRSLRQSEIAKIGDRSHSSL